ncbi:MAG: hypothetical protein LBD22_04685 [Spirochaetaceae bacterium]|jgi:dihydroorotate dehydrogenase electron transfer subunit|nr:hypothetical protein [Spirochaetaceae bacterium]
MNGALHKTTFLVRKMVLSNVYWELAVKWDGPAPEAGQFFMLKPRDTPVFLGRPFGVAAYQDGLLFFIVEIRGAGTAAITALEPQAPLELFGPLGKGFFSFIPAESKIALVSGGTGIAPLLFFAREYAARSSSALRANLYAGFKKSWTAPLTSPLFAAITASTGRFIHVSEEGITPAGVFPGAAAGEQGLVTDFFDAEAYDVVLCCGPEAMMCTVAAHCAQRGTSCLVSFERKMACGVGACRGCTVELYSGKRCCCTDGPVFRAEEIQWQMPIFRSK